MTDEQKKMKDRLLEDYTHDELAGKCVELMEMNKGYEASVEDKADKNRELFNEVRNLKKEKEELEKELENLKGLNGELNGDIAKLVEKHRELETAYRNECSFSSQMRREKATKRTQNTYRIDKITVNNYYG